MAVFVLQVFPTSSRNVAPLYRARLVALTKVENDPMKKPIVEFFLLCLSVEVVTSLSVWTSQPTHGRVDVYEGSFIKYETARLLPWA